MFFYQLYGMMVVSDLEMPRLLTAKPSDFPKDKQIIVCQSTIPAPYDQMPVKSYQYSPEVSFLSNDGCSILVKNGNVILYQIKPHPYATSLVSYILGFGMAMLFLQRQMLAFHCSSVSKNGKAVLIAGNSGSGKSTITNALLDRGYSLMSDDMTVVDPLHFEHPIAYPAFPFQKLCRDVVEKRNLNQDDLVYINEKKDKYLVPAPSFQSKEMPVVAMFHLNAADTLPVTAISDEASAVLGSNPSSDNFSMVWRKLNGLSTWEACKQALFLHAIVADHLHEKALAVPTLQFASACPMYHIIRKNNVDSSVPIVELIEKIMQS